MRKGLLVLVCLLLAGLAVRAAFANEAPPWVGKHAVGDVLTAEAYVIATNPEKTQYAVIVMSDTRQPVYIRATAEKGLVDPAVLGRPAMVKAKVVQLFEGNTSKIEILEVKLIKPGATP